MSDPASRPAVWMISGAFCLAAMGAFAHALGPRCDWLTIALVRVLFMFVSAVAAARASSTRLVIWRPHTLWLRSLAGSFSLVCNFYALTRLPVGDVLTLTNTYPLWIVALAWISARRRPSSADAIGVVCGLAGVVLIERPHLSGDDLAAAVALLGSVSTAIAMIGLHRLRAIDPKAIVAHFAGVASLVAGAWYVARGPGTAWAASGSNSHAHPLIVGPGADPVTLLLLLGVGVSGTFGQIFLTRAYASGAPTRVSVLGLTQVVFGLGFDVLLWHRTLSFVALAGTALVLAPTAWLVARAGARAPTHAESP